MACERPTYLDKMTELLELAIEFDVKGSWGEILPENLGNVDKENPDEVTKEEVTKSRLS